ncbi:MAG TPA: sigma-70 family RNA polymerase sigma factor [Planctomycetota bacterium]|nr:sigma-70 family RNA polymerase sigma factor [Planctomycetota bacterium]
MKTEEFEAKVAPLRESLGRFVSMMVGREAEDIVQEAIAAAFRDAAKFEGRSKFSTWLYGIAPNLCRKHLRDKSRHATSPGQEVMDAQPARGRGVLSSVIRHEMAERLEISVGRLPTSMREAFLLRYVDAMDYPEISSITGVSEGTARVRAFRARALLRGELGSVVDTIWLKKEDD